MRVLAALVCATAVTISTSGAGTSAPLSTGQRKNPVIRIDAQSRVHRVSPYLAGVNQRFYHRGDGFQEDGTTSPGLARQIRRAGITLLRYPGGTAGHFFDWTRAIGPQSERRCQVNGKGGNRVGSSFGPDEQQALAEATGAKTQIMVPFLRGTAQSAANWLEYMNNPVGGPNINGGVDWAVRRAANGHRAPYNITRWELGNEPFFQINRRWLPSGQEGSWGYNRALRVYALGGTVTQPIQPVGKVCSHRPRRALVDSQKRRQKFRVYYPPVRPFQSGQDQKVWVGGRWDDAENNCVHGADFSDSWREVDDLSTAGPQDRVYKFDNQLGKIVFGSGRQDADGVWQGHGLIPPKGSCVWVKYRSGPHHGFKSYYRAMKRVDAQIKTSDIDLCSGWGRPAWTRFAARHNIRYDCLITHPYRVLSDRWGSAREGYAEQMVGRARVNQVVRGLASALDRYTPDRWHAYLASSEYGVIGGRYKTQPRFPTWRSSMMRAIYNVTQLADFMRVGVPWAEGGMLLSGHQRGVISGPPHFVYSALARGLQTLRPMLKARGHTLRQRIVNNRSAQSKWGDYPALATIATKSSSGDVFVLVINRNPHASITARIAPRGFRWTSQARVWRMNAPSFQSVNTARHPHRVHLRTTRTNVGRQPFRMRFGEHSITLLRLNKR